MALFKFRFEGDDKFEREHFISSLGLGWIEVGDFVHYTENSIYKVFRSATRRK